MRKIYEFQHPLGFMFILANNTEDAVDFANEWAQDNEIFYIFGESDIILEEYVSNIPNGVFEEIEFPRSAK